MGAMVSTNRKRPRLRFSLRALFVLVTLCSIWLAYVFNGAHRQRQAVLKAEELNETVIVYYDYEFDSARDAPSPQWLVNLLGRDVFANVVSLDFTPFSRGDLPFSDKELEIVRDFPELRELVIMYTQVQGDGLVHVGRLTKLQQLDATHAPINDNGLSHLANLTSLKELKLGSTKVTDSGLKHIAGLHQLTELRLPDTHVTDEGIEHLRNLTNLEYLALNGTQIGDEGVARLGTLSNLRTLNLSRTKVTYKGLRRLDSLSKLEELYLKRIAISDDEILKLERALPNCRIRWSRPLPEGSWESSGGF